MSTPEERGTSWGPCASGRLLGPRLGNLEGAAIDRSYVEDFARLARGALGDLRVPERVAVLHARMAHAFVDPGFEGRRLADVETAHALRSERMPVAVHPDRADDRENGRYDGLREQ